MPFNRHRTTRRRRPQLAALLLSLAVTLVGLAAQAAPAMASHGLVSMIQDDREMLLNPSGTLLQLRQLGADQIRIAVRWGAIAPGSSSHHRPKHFNASDPAAYSAAAWAPFDQIVRDASNDGISVNFNVVGGAPLWATGPGQPKHSSWEPSASEFGAFVHALGVRYSGNYDPTTKRLVPGLATDIPRVNFWSIWNEPDYGPSLAPQALPGHPGVEDSPRLYRGLVDAAWGALHATGHAADTVLIGEIAPRSVGTTFGDFNGMLPLVFLRALYCLNGQYHPLRGTAASLRGCPTTAAGSRAFAAQNPVLFKATGFSDHPYMRWYPPNKEENSPRVADFNKIVSQFTTLGTIGNLERALGRVLAPYGVHRSFPVWNTEFGYITDPPKKPNPKNRSPYVSPTTAAYYDNWAEYMSWKDPQMMSFEQYLLEDPLPALSTNDYGGFASGLLFHNGSQKPGYAAWRMPLYLPKTTAQSPQQTLEVWGAVKPVHYAAVDLPGLPESVDILFAPQGSSNYTVLQTVPITDLSHGYFDTQVAFPSSGTVALAWTYPAGSLLAPGGSGIYSRHVQVTVK